MTSTITARQGRRKRGGGGGGGGGGWEAWPSPYKLYLYKQNTQKN
jgi:hypothetical protein